MNGLNLFVNDILNFIKYIFVSFILIIILFLIFFIILYALNELFILFFKINEIIINAISLTLGFAIIIFTYIEYSRRKEEKEPLIGFEISFDGNLISANGDSKSPKFYGDVKTNNVFLVLKNIGTVPLYNLHVTLQENCEESSNNKGMLREMKLPSLMPGEFKLFNTYITPEKLKNNKLDNICVIKYMDQTFTKKYSYDYNLKNNKEYILSLIEEFSQKNELSAIIAYKEILSLRNNSNVDKQIESINKTLDCRLHDIDSKMRR